jgi:hypothetical protein
MLEAHAAALRLVASLFVDLVVGLFIDVTGPVRRNFA